MMTPVGTVTVSASVSSPTGAIGEQVASPAKHDEVDLAGARAARHAAGGDGPERRGKPIVLEEDAFQV